jgi:hypothetical protein
MSISFNFTTKQNIRVTPVSLSNEQHIVSSMAPYVVKLIEVPQQTVPSSVSIPGYLEVFTTPTSANQYQVNYATGYITFTMLAAGQTVFVSYNGLGSIVDAVDVDTIQNAVVTLGNAAITAGQSAGGDLGGTYPNPTVTSVAHIANGILGILYGGTGTSTPSLIAGTNVTITGAWPNQTINSMGAVTAINAGTGISISSSTGNITISLLIPVSIANGGTGTTITFTQGSVIFAGASGIYSQDNSNFFWDNTNFRLGIGTPTPDQALQIATSNVISNSGAHIGPAYIGSAFPLGGSGSSADLQLSLDATKTTDYGLYLTNGGPTFLNSPTGTKLQLAVGNQTFVQIFSVGGGNGAVSINTNGVISSGSVLNILNGNAALQNDQNGDTYWLVKNASGGLNVSMQYALQSSSGAGQLVLGGPSATSLTLPVAANTLVLNAYSGSNLRLATTDANPMDFWTDTTQRMIITASGNVGISNSNPSYVLDVNGTGHFTQTLTLDVPLSVSSGGTGDSTLTTYGLLVGEGTSAVSSVGPSSLTYSMLLSGGSFANPSFLPLNAGSGISLSTGTGGITVTATGSGTVTAVNAGTGISVSGSSNVTVSLLTPVQVSNGGTSLSTITAHAVMVGEGTSSVGTVGPSSVTYSLLMSGGSSSDPSFLPLNQGNNIILSSGTGGITISASAPGTGTVTSVALFDGSSTPIYTISGSPVTTSGTLTFTLSNETANKVFAGPTSGGAAQPTFRSLGSSDIPINQGTGITLTTGTGGTTIALITPVSATNGGTGVSNPTTYGVLVGEGSSAVNSIGPSSTTYSLLMSGGSFTDPSFLPLNQGTGLTLTSGTGGITVALTTPVTVSLGGTGTNITFTSGSVVFADGSGIYSQNNSNFFWDNTNHRLGIGTATPSYTLDVGGDINSSTTYRISGVSGISGTFGDSTHVSQVTVNSGLVTSAANVTITGNLNVTVNNWTFTPPATAATLTAGGDALTYTLPTITCNIASEQIQQNSESTNYTTVLSDAAKHLLHPSADTTYRTFTIEANQTVSYPIGTAITFVNEHSAGGLTISIHSPDLMYLAGSGLTNDRVLAANGIATALKITSTEWIISGTNLT